VADAVVSIVVSNGLGTWRGSGFCIGDGSWVVTCRHVVSLDLGSGKRLPTRQVTVLSPWVGEAMLGQVAAVDEAADVALVRLDQPGLPALPLADDADRARLRAVGQGEGTRLAIAGYEQPAEGGDVGAAVTVQQREGVLISQRTDGGVTHFMLGPTPDVGKGWSGGPLFRPDSGAVVGVFHALVARATDQTTWFPQSISVGQLETLLKQAGVTDLAPFRAPPAATVARAADAEEAFRHEFRAAALSITRAWPAVEVERRALIKLRPESARAHNGLAVSLKEQGKREEALTAAAESLRLDPKRARTHLTQGIVLQGLGRLTEAEAAIRRAIELSGDDADAWVALGALLGAQKRREEATTALRKAVELAPNNPMARGLLGISLVQNEKADEGIAALREAVALGANFPPLRLMRLNLAQVLQATGRLDEAETEYRATVQAAEDNAPVHFYFAGFLRSRGKNEEALSQARRCLELKASSEMEKAAQQLVKELGG
jgi:tetratricopeptide (TPR) repeat protein